MGEIDERGHLGLSSRSRFMEAKETARTQNVQYMKPEFVVEEVSWLLEGFQVWILNTRARNLEFRLELFKAGTVLTVLSRKT